ncbi:type II secretion system F family protein [Maricaulis maris]|uniref:type II secretion system F family protein n=1 Tax=Maricaulis maris TaxID=74318 RepID=UPI003A93D661
MSDQRLWRYLAENASGEIERGEILATGSAQAMQLLAARGVVAVEVTELATAGRSRTGGRLTTAQVADFTEDLAELLGAALPIHEALASLAEGAGKRTLREFILRLEASVRSGRALSEAMKSDPARPPRTLVAMTAAGEESGQLAATLSDLALKLRADQALRRDLAGQLAYPAVLVCFIYLTLVFLAFFVLPQFETVFADAVVEPPPETRFVIAAGGFLRSYAIWIPVGIVGLVWLARVILARIPILASRIRRAVPIVGPALWRLDAAAYARTLGVLVRAGLPVNRAESVARDVVGDPGMRNGMSRAADRIRAGIALSSALDEQNILPDDLIRQVRLGEETGDLDKFLLRTADRYERMARTRLSRALELLGPVLVAILGACVAGVIASVMSGVLSLNDAVF